MSATHSLASPMPLPSLTMSQDGFMQASRQRVNARLWAANASDEGSAQLTVPVVTACSDRG